MDILAIYPGIPGLFVAAAYSGTLRWGLKNKENFLSYRVSGKEIMSWQYVDYIASCKKLINLFVKGRFIQQQNQVIMIKYVSEDLYTEYTVTDITIMCRISSGRLNLKNMAR